MHRHLAFRPTRYDSTQLHVLPIIIELLVCAASFMLIAMAGGRAPVHGRVCAPVNAQCMAPVLHAQAVTGPVLLAQGRVANICRV